MRRTREVMAWAAAVLVGGCEQPRTELVVRVDSEVAWGPGRSVQSVVLTVRRGGSTGPLRSLRTTELGLGAEQRSLPLYVGVAEASDDTDTPVWIEALGCSDSAGCTAEMAVVAQRATVRFVRGQTLEVPLLLASACVGMTCASDERCATSSGQCEAASRAQETVRVFTGPVAPIADDASVVEDVPEDIEVLADSTVDAGVDVAMDVALVDVPDVPAAIDAGAPDMGVLDTGLIDTGPRDTGPADTRPVDTGPVDTGPDTGGERTITCPLPFGMRTCLGANACCFTFSGLPAGCGCTQAGGLLCLPCH